MLVDPDNLVPMGYITGAFGIKGWVKINSSTEHADSLAEYSDIYLKIGDKWVSKEIESSFVKNAVFHAKFVQVEDREAAAALKGATVAVPRKLFPEPAENEYYWVDLIGLAVINLDNQALGVVNELIETGANDVLVVEDTDNKRLIPFVAVYIIKVDLPNKQIIVDWGLDY